MTSSHGELVVEDPTMSNQRAQNLTNSPVVQQGKRELLKIKGLWPLDFFPDELTIEEKMVTVKRNILLASHTETILIQEIGEVTITSTAFLSSLSIFGALPGRKLTMANIPHDKAKAAKAIIDSLMIREKS